MPTPFMHLQMADRLDNTLKSDGCMSTLLANHWPDFLLGSIAPDFQVICDIPRENTHYYPIPPVAGDYEAFARFLKDFPELADSRHLEADQAIFIAAYGIHLLFDQLWDHRVLTPYFRHAEWGSPLVRFTAHNTLLTYLDREALHQLPEHYGRELTRANSDGRLPFDPDGNLARWQVLISNQLQPGAPVQTVDIYASRLRISSEKFTAQLNDTEWMTENVFRHVSLDVVYQTLTDILPLGIDLLHRYFAPLFSDFNAR